jgi:hypothetical protein
MRTSAQEKLKALKKARKVYTVMKVSDVMAGID